MFGYELEFKKCHRYDLLVDESRKVEYLDSNCFASCLRATFAVEAEVIKVLAVASLLMA